MAYLPLLDPDDDLLPLLRSAPNDLLDPLVSYITNNGQGRLTSEVDKLELYKQQYPNHHLYVDDIAAELQKFGGNTIANFFRGGKGIFYRQVVCNVADQLRGNYNELMDVASIETQILLKILEKAYAQMSEEEQQNPGLHPGYITFRSWYASSCAPSKRASTSSSDIPLA